MVLIAREGNATFKGVAAGRADDIPNEQEGERPSYLRADAFAFF